MHQTFDIAYMAHNNNFEYDKLKKTVIKLYFITFIWKENYVKLLSILFESTFCCLLHFPRWCRSVWCLPEYSLIIAYIAESCLSYYCYSYNGRALCETLSLDTFNKPTIYNIHNLTNSYYTTLPLTFAWNAII